ncbi:hypothetical protein OG777_28500 [Micromonospora peucetia]|uniref:Uncharacterized protein n=1 Tax=Micromonospora peucetia TaxID=47871 RepID=A0A1C6W1G5_9ACTN|nr:hypothetical protein [Micromonospora peucetia]MCX4390843.1 hypothetical protein [Micromonospora peucetia]WSA31780.1 hypothetical protein OIE14_27260 [Micromonospora peucetia]SCL72010.1 hypothetical protein GA0070608_4823 [Micromonospora peucetia]
MTEPQNTTAELVVDAAHAAVRRLAPEELPIFDEVAAGWRRQLSKGGPTWSVPQGGVGFGIDVTLLTELVLQVVAAAVGEVLVLGATAARVGLLRRRRRELPAPPEAGPGLDSTQARRLREACHRHAVALGLDPARAELLADAAVGAMVDPPDA